MITHIPTIQDLNRKTVHELHVMFHDAASLAANTKCTAHERSAARQTLEHIRRSLAARTPRP